MSIEKGYYIGIDVGTGSARVGIFKDGQLISTFSKAIEIHNPAPSIYEQSSENIWSTIVEIVKKAASNIQDKHLIKGLSFCATCSLVAVSENGSPVSVSSAPDDSNKWNIVMWMDHRAEKEAEQINTKLKGHKLLSFVGGKISLEMQTPKLLWLQNNLKESFESTKEYFDLPDFLRWKATGSLKRSLCSVTCKWTYDNTPGVGCGWDPEFFKNVGLSPQLLNKIGNRFSNPGDFDTISEMAANELGLPLTVKVGYSLIDAHSGVLGMLGCKSSILPNFDVTKRLALICGTSNCHMALSNVSHFVEGIWGPYFGVILPNLYLNEGGQSAAGKLLDFVVSSSKAYGKVMESVDGDHGKVLSKLEEILLKIPNYSELTNELHLWPDFHGNRSPLADPTLKGMISGLTLSETEKDLTILYLATVQALGYGSRHIVEEMEATGHSFDSVVICGGLAKSKIFLQSHADILKLPVLVPSCPEPVLLGAAISAAAAVNSGNVETVMQEMSGNCDVIMPNVDLFEFHDKKFKVFLEMVNDQKKYRNFMK